MSNQAIKCNECGKVSVPDLSKWGSEPDICDDCLKKGWSEVTLDDMKKDPELFGKVVVKSPYEKD